jgi:hypothetical protein
MSQGFTEPFVGSPRSAYGPYPYRSKMGLVPSAEWNVFHDDFNINVAANAPTGWTTIIDTGATLVSLGTAGFSSSVVIASDGASEGVSIYTPENIQLTSGKKFFMEAMVYTSIAAETDVQIGLSDLTAVTNPEDLWTTTSASLVAFGTLAGSATTKMLADKSNTGSTAETGTRALSNNTWHRIAFNYDGVNLRGYVDGKLSLLWAQASTTIPTGVSLAPFIGARTGATAGNLTYVDYFRYVGQR